MADQIQLRSKGRHIIAEGRMRDGSTFWTSPANARLYIDQGIAEPVGSGPAETQRAGPTETKPAEPAEKKSSAAAPDGLSTGSAKSSGSATTAAPSSASPGGQASRGSTARSSKRGADKAASGE